VLVGGKAGDGINSAGLLVSHLLSSLGFLIYMYFDYPSLIRGGHNFAIIRAAERKVGTHRKSVDFILALSQETVERHRHRLRPGSVVIYNRDLIRSEGIGISFKEVLEKEHAPPVMGNTCLIGAFAKASGIEWSAVEQVIRKHLPKGTDLNLAVARRGYENAPTAMKLERPHGTCSPVLTGNEAIGLGLVKGGLEVYISYPMTPSSSLLHFLAEMADEFSLKVIHPENEIAVVLMAQGFAYAGKRTAVGTSGGGFCLMTEGLSMAGMAEIPIVFLVSQRTGPSTGLPTYTAQSDLHFVRYAGQGEFPRFIVAPGDAEQAIYWSAVAMSTAWKFQVPAFVLSDKDLSEGSYSVSYDSIPPFQAGTPPLWDGTPPYNRYSLTESGVSPLAFPPARGAAVKVNSYAHDPFGITTEDPEAVVAMAEKRKRKGKSLIAAVESMPSVNIRGAPDATTALLCWGSNLWLCSEAADELGMKMIQPVVLEPFPVDRYRKAAGGVDLVISIEDNTTGQLASHVRQHGFRVDREILRFDGRPFALEELLQEIKKVTG
jgi:2-oxoglutarate ferredoxin oxidoreductase subunit alpha